MRHQSVKLLVPVLLLGLIGCGGRTPAKFETAIATAVKQKVTVRGKGEQNPLASTPENIRAGKEAFSSYCMVCHGLDGQNTGVPFADKMSPPVPLLTSDAVQHYTDGQIKWVIEHGIFPSGMPASKDVLSDEEMWRIVVYVRHLPPKGSLGEPAVYGGTPPETESTKK